MAQALGAISIHQRTWIPQFEDITLKCGELPTPQPAVIKTKQFSEPQTPSSSVLFTSWLAQYAAPSPQQDGYERFHSGTLADSGHAPCALESLSRTRNLAS